MNIAVKPYGSDLCHCRPDTTMMKENRDFYSPEGVNSLHWAPILFARISKAGKCIGDRFAERYYDSFGFGALLYIGDTMPDKASSSCADHTSLLPFPLYNPIVLEGKDNCYEVLKDGVKIFGIQSSHTAGLKEQLEKAICKASILTSLRIGDLVAVELAPITFLADHEEETIRLKGNYCENSLYDIKVIF